MPAPPNHDAGVSPLLSRLKNRIGDISDSFVFTVTRQDVARWADATEDLAERWLDEAPPTLLVSRRPDIWDDWVAEVSTFGTQWLNGGDSVILERAIPLETPISCWTTIANVELCEGRSGSLLIFQSRTDFKILGGERVCTINGSMIRR